MMSKNDDSQSEYEQRKESDPLLTRSDADDSTPPDELHSGFLATIADAVTGGMEVIVEGVQSGTDTIVEGAHDIGERVQETTSEFQEAVVEQYNEVKETFLDELHEADDGDMYFLDMALTRNLSILPSELREKAQQLAGPTTKTELDLETLTLVEKAINPLKPPLSAYAGLALAVTSLSSIGPLLALQSDVSGTLKIFWRMCGTALVLLPLAILELRTSGFPRLTQPQWCTFLVATACYVTMGVGFALALSYTSVGNAVILANSQALMLLMGNLCVGAPVSYLEGVGALVAFTGAVLCSKDSSEDGSVAAAPGNTFFGDFLALLSGMGGVGYLVFAKTSRSNMSLFLFTFLTMSIGCLMIIPFQIIVLREKVTLGMNPRTGLLGFLNWTPDRLQLEIIMVLVCNVCGTMGYVRAMQFFDSLVISVAGLMEPVVAEFMAFFLNVGILPGSQGWLGNFLVAVGTLAVVFPTDKKGGPTGH